GWAGSSRSLRDGNAQDHAFLGEASTIAQALAQLPFEALLTPMVRGRWSIRIDDYADDWLPDLRSHPSSFSAHAALALDGRRLYLLEKSKMPVFSVSIRAIWTCATRAIPN
ncbi:MAG: hypothetical protein ABIP56_03120, partial [Dokdonella sp.]